MSTIDPNVFPHDDEDMVFDELLQMYVLTERCAEKLGISLSDRLRQKGAINPEAVINSTFRQISTMIYQYLHAHVLNTVIQDKYLKHLPSARPIIQQALEQQFQSYLVLGNLYWSTDKEKRAMAIDELAKSILDTYIPELGHPLTYTGRWNRCRLLTF